MVRARETLIRGGAVTFHLGKFCKTLIKFPHFCGLVSMKFVWIANFLETEQIGRVIFLVISDFEYGETFASTKFRWRI